MYETIKKYFVENLIKEKETPKEILKKNLQDHASEEKFLTAGYKNKIIYCLGKKYIKNRTQRKLSSDKSLKVRVALAFNLSININTIEVLAEDAEVFTFKSNDKTVEMSPVLGVLDNLNKYDLDDRQRNDVLNIIIEFHSDLFDKIAKQKVLNLDNVKEILFFGEGLSSDIALVNENKDVLDYLYKEYELSRKFCLKNKNFNTKDYIERFDYLSEEEQAVLIEISEDMEFVLNTFDKIKDVMSEEIAAAFKQTNFLEEDAEIELFNFYIDKNMQTESFKNSKSRIIRKKMERNSKRGVYSKINEKDILIFDFIKLVEISDEELLNDLKDFVLNKRPDFATIAMPDKEEIKIFK